MDDNLYRDVEAERRELQRRVESLQYENQRLEETNHTQDKSLIASLTEIKSSTGAMQRQIENLNMHRANSPVQMNALVAGITEMYAQHDQDQKTIVLLKREILELKQKNQALEDQLRQINSTDRAQDTWEPEY